MDTAESPNEKIITDRGFKYWRRDLDVALQCRYRMSIADLSIDSAALVPLVRMSLFDAAVAIADHYGLKPMNANRESLP